MLNLSGLGGQTSNCWWRLYINNRRHVVLTPWLLMSNNKCAKNTIRYKLGLHPIVLYTANWVTICCQAYLGTRTRKYHEHIPLKAGRGIDKNFELPWLGWFSSNSNSEKTSFIRISSEQGNEHFLVGGESHKKHIAPNKHQSKHLEHHFGAHSLRIKHGMFLQFSSHHFGKFLSALVIPIISKIMGILATLALLRVMVNKAGY